MRALCFQMSANFSEREKKGDRVIHSKSHCYFIDRQPTSFEIFDEFKSQMRGWLLKNWNLVADTLNALDNSVTKRTFGGAFWTVNIHFIESTIDSDLLRLL